MNVLIRDKTPHICIVGNGWWGKGLREALVSRNYNFTILTSKSQLSDIQRIRCDMVFECTGDPNVCKDVADMCLDKRLNLMTVNSEFDSHYGTHYYEMFNAQNLSYSMCIGDQPGSLVKMRNEIDTMGFTPTVFGVCKRFEDKYQTPEGVQQWVKDGHQSDKICSFADGTKLNIEACVICNSADATPDVRGMHGLNCTRDELVDAFSRLSLKPKIVDYTLGVKGINQEAGIFIIAKLKQPSSKFTEDMKYLKMGNGPHYLFFKDYHLCYFEAVESVVKLAEYNIPGVESKYENADVATIAKRNLKKGEVIGGIGSEHVYGEVDTVHNIDDAEIIPIALCKNMKLKYDIAKDTAVTLDMICI